MSETNGKTSQTFVPEGGSVLWDSSWSQNSVLCLSCSLNKQKTHQKKIKIHLKAAAEEGNCVGGHFRVAGGKGSTTDHLNRNPVKQEVEKHLTFLTFILHVVNFFLHLKHRFLY